MSTINYLTRIEFGEGEVARLPDFLAALGVKHPLIATDKGLVATGLVQRIAGLLSGPCTVFDGTPANPTEDAVLAWAVDQLATSGRPFTLKKGKSITQRVGVLVHKGDSKEGRVAERYALYIEGYWPR